MKTTIFCAVIGASILTTSIMHLLTCEPTPPQTTDRIRVTVTAVMPDGSKEMQLRPFQIVRTADGRLYRIMGVWGVAVGDTVLIDASKLTHDFGSKDVYVW